jgi:Rps23 Pro-64 3,4-dihydroxylase Tpa1-like proline 4-hydroxylase
LLDFLNTPEILGVVSKISGRDDLRSADGQVTAYTPGHYLTRHRDRIDGEERRLAYVLGFTREWHPDWGGLLQFYDDDGSPRDAWAPRFNSLALFDVRHVHAVTYVTPYARKPRLSLTGWFRSTE